MKIKSLISWKVFSLLLGAGIIGTLAVFPYLFSIQGEALKDLPLSLPMILVLSLAQTTILLSLATFIGLLLGKKVGLGAPLLEDWLAHGSVKERFKSVGMLGVKCGVLVGLVIIGLDYVFTLFTESIASVGAPLWQGFLGSFYGGIVEELLLRLFLVTLLVWLMWRFSASRSEKPTSRSVWIAIIAAAVIFGLGHLPATAVLTTITPFIVLRAVFLNGIGGIVFGWLYWKKGIEAAIVAHFTVDIILLVLLPLALMLVN